MFAGVGFRLFGQEFLAVADVEAALEGLLHAASISDTKTSRVGDLIYFYRGNSQNPLRSITFAAASAGLLLRHSDQQWAAFFPASGLEVPDDGPHLRERWAPSLSIMGLISANNGPRSC